MTVYSPVTFKIEADTSSAMKAVDELEKRLKGNSFSLEIKLPTAKRLSIVTQKLSEMANVVRWFSGGESFSKFADGVAKLGGVKISKSVMDFFRDGTIASQLRSFADSVADFPDVENFAKFTQALANLNSVRISGSVKNLAKGIADAGNIATETPAVKTTVPEADYSETIFGKISAELGGISGLWGTFKSGAVSALKTATSYAKKFLSTLKDVAVKGFNKLTDSIKHATSGLTSFLNSIGRIAMYRAIRSVIKEITQAFSEGISNMYQWALLTDNQFAPAMDKLASSAMYLKNSLAAMLAPAIEALVPIIQKVVEAFVSATNAVNQFISAITGKSTWTKAVYTPVKYAEQEIDKTTNKVKELKKTILGFDELNILTDNTENDSSASNAGGTSPDYGSMFKEEPLSDFWKKWLNTDDWYELGRLTAQKLNELLKQVDEWLLNVARPWAMKWSKRIATFLNGLVDEFDFRLLGKTIADGLMIIVDSVNQFFDIFQAYNFGARLWETVDEFFNTMNWEAVGQFFANGINFVADTAAGFLGKFVDRAYTYGKDLATAFKAWVDDIHWDNIRSALSDGLRSVANLVKGFVSNEDGAWDKFKTEFIKTINSVIGSPSLTDLLEAGGKLINSIVDMLGELDWYGVGYQIGTFLGSVDWLNALTTAVSAIGSALMGALKGWFESDNAFGNTVALAIVAAIGGVFAVGGSVATAGLKIAGESIASQIAGGITTGAGTSIASAVTNIAGVVATSGAGIPLAVAGIMADVAGVIKLADLGLQISAANAELAVAQANEASAAVKLQTALASQGINASLDDINAHLNGTISWAELTGGKFNSMTQTVASDMSGMAKNTNDTFDKLGTNTKDFTEDVNKAVVNFLEKSSDGSSESMKKLSDDTVKIFSDVSDAISRINQALSNSFSQMASSISQSMQRMYDSVSTNMAKIASNVENAANRIQSAFNSVSSVSTTVKVQGYATGGFPEDGLFMANSGELVGGFTNGKTAVANNEQITTGIEQGVYNAVMNAMSAQGSADIVIRIDSEEIARANTKGMRKLDRRINPTVKFTG